jgi:hypothetical protein
VPTDALRMLLRALGCVWSDRNMDDALRRANIKGSPGPIIQPDPHKQRDRQADTEKVGKQHSPYGSLVFFFRVCVCVCVRVRVCVCVCVCVCVPCTGVGGWVSGTATFDQFAALVHQAPRLSADPLRFAFRALDPTQSGLVRLSDLKHLLMAVGDRLSPAEFDAFRAGVYVDEDGRVAYEGTGHA